jgi:DNA-binding transcriptional regulator LsrR (DeoR family)
MNNKNETRWWSTSDLLEFARLYHEDRLTQQQIGDLYNVNKMQISRALTRAEKEGIIRVQIIAPPVEEMRRALMKRFKLKDAIVVTPSTDFPFERQSCADRAADYFDKLVFDFGIKSVGLGGGHTLYGMVKALRTRERSIHIYPTAIRGRGWAAIMTPDRAVVCAVLWSKSGEKTSTAYNATVAPYAPFRGIEELAERRQELFERPIIQKIFRSMKTVECVFTTLGTADDDVNYRKESPQASLNMLKSSGITPKYLRSLGIVGEVSYNYFDGVGNTKPEWDTAISLGVDHLKKMVSEDKQVVIIAGRYKEKALKAALSSGMGNVVITDARTARMLLDDDA